MELKLLSFICCFRTIKYVVFENLQLLNLKVWTVSEGNSKDKLRLFSSRFRNKLKGVSKNLVTL